MGHSRGPGWPLGLGLGLLTAGRWSPSGGGHRGAGLAGCLNSLSPSRYHGLWSWPPHSARPRRHWPWPTGRPEEAVPVCGVRGWGRPWSWATGQWHPPGHRLQPVGRACASVFTPLSLTLHAPNSLLFSLMPRLPTGSGWAQSGSTPTASETLRCPPAAARRVGLPATGA